MPWIYGYASEEYPFTEDKSCGCKEGGIFWDDDKHIRCDVCLTRLEEKEKRLEELNDPKEILICNQCDRIETPPFDEGDKCYCGGTFISSQ